MNNKKFILLSLVFLFLIFFKNEGLAGDVKVIVGTATAPASDVVHINIMAEPVPGGTPTVAAAAFTLKYDRSLNITVENSSFFDTFINQGYTPGEYDLDDNGLVDGYDSPFITNETYESEMKLTKIAAARKDSAEIHYGMVLLTLSVTGTKCGTFNIDIIPTELNYSAGGWNGKSSDLLIDVDGTNFPVRLSAIDAENPQYVVNGSVNIACGSENSIELTIIDANTGLPVPNAEIDFSTEMPLTYQEGKYTGAISPGEYLLTIDAPGYVIKTDNNFLMPNIVEGALSAKYYLCPESLAITGNFDCSDNTDLADVIIALKISAGINLADLPLIPGNSLDGNKIGIKDAVFLLKKSAGE